jgi:hypothetical protein
VAAAHPAQQLVTAIVDEPRANISATLTQGRLTFTYDLAPWALTLGTVKSNFDLETARIVPAVFDRFQAGAAD